MGHLQATRPNKVNSATRNSIIKSRVDGSTDLGKMLFQISFGVNGGARKVHVYENDSIEAAADRFCSQHSLDIEHRKTLVRMLDMRMRAHIAKPSQPESSQEPSKKSKRRPQRQPQRQKQRKAKPPPQEGAAKANVVVVVVANNDQSSAARSAQTDEVYVLPVHVNGNEHLLGIKKDVSIEKLAASFCDVLGISATDEFILHLSIVDGIKRHHAKMLKLLRLQQPVTPLKFHFSLPA